MNARNREKPYRPCVVGVFINKEHQVLVALRSDVKMWQFPQGGVDEGESFQEALYREMKEEIGCDHFSILAQSSDFIYYDFPETLKAPVAKEFRGQKQMWYLCQFNEGFGPDISKVTSPEFLKTRWTSPQKICESIVDWKKEPYRLGLSSLGVLKEKSPNAKNSAS